ncbi:IclR family transcriptional regulator [Rhizorhapis sp.]|uniref:IclR family transcriptional regulator n=1 Tax=Rhizorhapis sp. TaxID=1968842 RepID=UPI002B4767F3|nr:IclR family transcriptional regulator [Rhizorhapis sp.]HKR17943.1 IclR family transcriptional regulator [Rhizorhapis sp.]
MTQNASRRENPRSAVRILQILDKLSDDSQEWTLSSLGRELNSPKSSLLALLRALIDMGHIHQAGGIYKLDGEAFRLASHILLNRHFPEVARPILREIVEKTGETAVIGVLSEDGQSTIYVDKVESPSALRFSAKIGDRRPLYSSASGHVILAFGDREMAAAYMKKIKVQPLTPSGIASKAELKEAIDLARARGIAVTRNQSTEGVTGFGAPILGETGELIGSLVLAAPTSRIEVRMDEMSQLAKQTAVRISEIMGYND